MQLLLETADMVPPEKGLEAPRQAFEIVELCGRLPLTVAIAGGVVRNHGGLEYEVHLFMATAPVL